MLDQEREKNNILLGTAVCFKSELEILELGELISKRIFGGLHFGGLDDYICEEIPAIYIDESVLGFQVILNGFREEHYCLHFSLYPSSPSMVGKDILNYNFINNGFREHMKFILKQIPELDVFDE